jgi:hypothetical protein
MKLSPCAFAIALVFVAATVHAQKVYKHVDTKGNVTYSQTPPAHDAKPVDVPPARRVPPHPYLGRNNELHAERLAERQAAQERRQLEYERRQQEMRDAQQEARQRQLEALQAECHRNRGTDCSDPATLKRMEAERGPNQYRPRVR